MSIDDVVIHVSETRGAQERHDLADQLREIDGVIAPRFNDRQIHLMIVAYDREHIRTMTLRDAVRNQGYHAQHCGA
jgi:hypothetical protein